MSIIQLPPDSKILSPNFLLGAATASYQIEGAADADGRIASIWDTFSAVPGNVLNGDTGAIACNHYGRLSEDIEHIKRMELQAYRFSVAWPRIMTTEGAVNQKGLDFYRRLVDELLQEGIQPWGTLYHWDLPQHLEDKGGWLNRDTAYRFAEYAEVVTRGLPGVASWATFNEPWVSAFLGYWDGVHAPGVKGGEKAGRQAGHYQLLAHGLGMQVIRANAPHVMAGIVMNVMPHTPLDIESPHDRHAAQVADAGLNDWFIAPVLTGQYPSLYCEQYPQMVPDMAPGDLLLIAQPMDFMGINYYTRNRVEAQPSGPITVKAAGDAPKTFSGWEIYPQGLTDILLQLNRNYDLPPIYITENGAAFTDELAQGTVKDTNRVRFLEQHLCAVDAAIKAGVDIRGFLAWSLLDNYEWEQGYSQRFGLIHIDYASQDRTWKDSAHAWRALIASRK